MQPIQGLHHITAVTGNIQANVDFYRLVLGQRMVKTTVNFDDPGTYHFYFADDTGSPGTLITFFPWQNMPQGQIGNGETGAIGYTIPSQSVGYWRARLTALGLKPERTEKRFGAEIIPFTDPDGIKLELITDDTPFNFQFWADGPIPHQHALRGFHGVTLWLAEVTQTAALLTDHFGYTFVGQEGNRYRYQAPAREMGTYVDLLHRPGQPFGRFGVGSVHHIAFRTADNTEQLEYQHSLAQTGLGVTEVRNRIYFQSIYFRTPGGVLFEIATDGPGMSIDEPVESLGESLKLPPWVEPHRAAIEQSLPPFELKPVTPQEAVNA